MNVLRTRNVHRALPLALELLRMSGDRRESRNGPVLQARGPVATVYDNPCERVMFWAERDANPFFHFFESLWMLGGCNDIASVVRFNKRFTEYSDDGKITHGAYGYRWRERMPYFHSASIDQLILIADALHKDKTDRRQVLQIWDAASDLGRQTKDAPCNLTVTFQINPSDELDMVVFNRSNDIIWGCYGANAVHFSFLLEYMALRIGAAVGTYTQVSVNWHGYEATYMPLYAAMLYRANLDTPTDVDEGNLTPLIEDLCPYEMYGKDCVPYPLAQFDTDMDLWDTDLRRLLRSEGRAPSEGVWCDPFFTDVAIPILRCHDIHKEPPNNIRDRYERAIAAISKCQANDWRMACTEWLTRRFMKAVAP